MKLEAGKVVINNAGRDKGRFFLVLGLEKGYAFIADGKYRKIETPKRKSIKHLSVTNSSVELSQLTNKKLRTALRDFNSGQDIDEESE